MNSVTTTEKIETLRHTMDRYDHYYDSINNKGSLFLALNTFLLGALVTGYYNVKNEINIGSDLLFFAWSCSIFCLLSIAFSLWATMPYLSRQSDSINGSVIYFGNVANLSIQSFKQMYSSMTDEKRFDDYLQQVHLLALGLQKKFRRLQIAAYLLGGCFLCIIIIGFKILK